MRSPKYAVAVCAVALVLVLAGCDYSSVVLPTPPPSPFPTAGTTGFAVTGVTLHTYTGPATITADGTTLDSVLIPFAITIAANNVTITRSEILGATADTYVVEQDSG